MGYRMSQTRILAAALLCIAAAGPVLAEEVFPSRPQDSVGNNGRPPHATISREDMSRPIDSHVAPATYEQTDERSLTAGAEISRPATSKSIPLGREESPRLLERPADARTGNGSSTSSALWSVAASLGLVLGLFLLAAWMLRRGLPRRLRPLSAEVVEVLGRAPLAAKQQMHLLRFGHKLVLVAVSPAGVESIAEITEPTEVERLAGLCHSAAPTSSSASFRGVLGDFVRESSTNAPTARRGGMAGLFGRRRPSEETNV